MHPRRVLLLMIIAVAITAAGCSRRLMNPATPQPAEHTVARGVVYRAFPEGDPFTGASEVYLLDADLNEPGVRVRVVAENAGVQGGRVYADTYKVNEWCERYHAVAGVNGGFFGQTDGIRKEVVGLLATDGVLHSTGGLVRSRRAPGQRFARSVLGFGHDGVPRIGWAVGRKGRAALLTDFAGPVNPTSLRYWNASSAVACGPRLLERGALRITDSEERLASPVSVARTFAAYSVENGKPRHLVLAVATAMTYREVADFLQRYFQRYHKSRCEEAMCLDGGSSSQLAYRSGSGYNDARPTVVTVPTAVLITAN